MISFHQFHTVIGRRGDNQNSMHTWDGFTITQYSRVALNESTSWHYGTKTNLEYMPRRLSIIISPTILSTPVGRCSIHGDYHGAGDGNAHSLYTTRPSRFENIGEQRPESVGPTSRVSRTSRPRCAATTSPKTPRGRAPRLYQHRRRVARRARAAWRRP
jgi:hypothetical protein